MSNKNTCVCCGEVIPEGRQICPRHAKELLDNMSTQRIYIAVARGNGKTTTYQELQEYIDAICNVGLPRLLTPSEMAYHTRSAMLQHAVDHIQKRFLKRS